MKINEIFVADGHLLILLTKIENVKDGIYKVEKKRRTNYKEGTVIQVGRPDEFGDPLWEVGDIVFAPGTGGQIVEIDGHELYIIHHRRVYAGKKIATDAGSVQPRSNCSGGKANCGECDCSK